MFCNQCEQTTRNGIEIGCTIEGVCGKTSQTSSLQDVIVYALEGLSAYACLLNHNEGGNDISEINALMLSATFATLTNVNFDDESLFNTISAISDAIADAQELCECKAISTSDLPAAAKFKVAKDIAMITKQGDRLAIMNKRGTGNADVDSLRALILFGIKGVAAYTHHAKMLGQNVEEIADQIQEAYLVLAKNVQDVDTLLGLSLKLGEINISAMAKLETGHKSLFGTPEPTSVRVTAKQGKSILVSGHDILDLENILKQTAGKGINVYTHGELLPGNSYPNIKKYPHLVGNYGGAWQEQQVDFTKFKGAILMTSNCIQKPMPGYEGRIFTCGPVGWPGVEHINGHDFSKVVDCALNVAGFEADEEEKCITTGFGKDAILGAAEAVVSSVKAGDISRFYLVGGCDGSEAERNYFTEVAENIADDAIIMTLGCAKFRFNKKEFGDINGIPRLLDLGQCNDSYGAIQVAVALAGAFECEVNELPLSFYVSWLEQKAVAVLLSLLHLGIKNIHLGPQLPGFLSDNVINILVETFDLKPTGNAAADIKAELV